MFFYYFRNKERMKVHFAFTARCKSTTWTLYDQARWLIATTKSVIVISLTIVLKRHKIY